MTRMRSAKITTPAAIPPFPFAFKWTSDGVVFMIALGSAPVAVGAAEEVFSCVTVTVVVFFDVVIASG